MCSRPRRIRRWLCFAGVSGAAKRRCSGLPNFCSFGPECGSAGVAVTRNKTARAWANAKRKPSASAGRETARQAGKANNYGCGVSSPLELSGGVLAGNLFAALNNGFGVFVDQKRHAIFVVVDQ